MQGRRCLEDSQLRSGLTANFHMLCVQGVGFFPHDFPDTPAYARLAAELHAEQERLRQLRPKGRFPPGTPHPPDWAAVGSSGLLKTPTPSAGPPKPEEHAAAADMQPMDQDGQERPSEEQAPAPMDAISVEPTGAQSLAEDTIIAVDEIPAEAGSPTAMDIEPSAQDEAGLEAACAADNDNTAARSAADEAPQALPAVECAALDAVPAPRFYVARTLAQLDAAMTPQASPAIGPSDPVESAEVSEGSSAPAEAPAGSRRGRQIWRSVAETDTLSFVRVSVQVIGLGVAEEGAALCALAPSEAADLRRAMMRRKAPKRVDIGQGQLAAAAQSGQQENVREVVSRWGEHEAEGRQIIGYITSAAPRGLVSCICPVR